MVSSNSTTQEEEFSAFLTAELAAGQVDPQHWDKPRHINRAISSVLQLLDMTNNHARISGMDGLLALLTDAPADLLDSIGVFELTFEAIFRLVQFQDSELLHHVYPCLVDIIRTQESVKKKVPARPRFGELDKVDRLLIETLKQLTLFSDGKMRACLGEHFLLLLRSFGFRVAKYFPRILSVTEMLIASQVKTQQLLAVNLLEECTLSCWPVFPNHLERICLQLMKMLLQNTLSGDEAGEEKVGELFAVLRRLDEESVVGFVEKCLLHRPFPADFSTKMRRLISMPI
ncbi:hypothetical protein BV898_06693 [Hypsibius exemplaris]|uniref:TELO2-interacting protein 2-like protein n=1 Tax=Hypsibius exemplaris TaxID=2072580 RepID=A0A1W0WVR4_HYPEX|nr:hypothetical protein BV898_06693 [Hypsibius exemplaris]